MESETGKASTGNGVNGVTGNRDALIQRLHAELLGVVHKMPYDQAFDKIHETLLLAGVTESEALDLNTKLREELGFGPRRLRTFELFLTRNCNLDCPYCFVHRKEPEVMARETLDSALQFIIENRDPSSKTSVVFMGGEPTMCFGRIKHAVGTLLSAIGRDHRKIRFDITSNGTLITEEMMQFFSRNNVKVLLSLDGDRESHDLKRRTSLGEGTFDRIVENLPMIRRYQPYLGARMTIAPERAEWLLHDIRVVSELGFRKIIVGPATGVEWSAQALEVFEEQYRLSMKWLEALSEEERPSCSLDEATRETALCDSPHRWGCRAGRTGIAIDTRGRISPCSKVIGVEEASGGAMWLGDVFKGITNEALHLKLNGLVPVNRDGCWSCSMRAGCAGGCYATNLESHGDPWGVDPMTCSVRDVMLRIARERSSEASAGVAGEPAKP